MHVGIRPVQEEVRRILVEGKFIRAVGRLAEHLQVCPGTDRNGEQQHDPRLREPSRLLPVDEDPDPEQESSKHHYEGDGIRPTDRSRADP